MEILNNVIYLLSYCNIITCETIGLYHIYCRENPFQYRKRYFKIIGSHKVVRTGPYRLFHLRLSKVLPPTFCNHANTLQIWCYKLLCFVLTRNAKQQIAIIAFYLLLEDCLHANEKLLAR